MGDRICRGPGCLKASLSSHFIDNTFWYLRILGPCPSMYCSDVTIKKLDDIPIPELSYVTFYYLLCVLHVQNFHSGLLCWQFWSPYTLSDLQFWETVLNYSTSSLFSLYSPYRVSCFGVIEPPRLIFCVFPPCFYLPFSISFSSVLWTECLGPLKSYIET